MLMDSKIARLEDYGVRNTTTPQDRYAQYIEDCKGLPKHKQAEFWLKTMKHDVEVGRLMKTLGDGNTSRDER
jgi:hypothetical protein